MRCVNGSLGENLSEARRGEAGLGKAHSYGVDLAVAGYHASYACATCAITFRYRVEEDSVALKTFELHHAEMFVAIVAKLTVYFVGEKVAVVFFDQSGNFKQLLVGVEVARGVVGVAYHDGFSARSYYLFEIFDGRQGEACLDVAGDGYNFCVAQFGEGVVIGVVRFWDYDFVARVKTNCESHL